MRSRDRGIVGEATLDFIRQFRVEYAIIGISGIDGDGTLLSYESHAAVGGKLAQVGQRVIKAASDKLTAEFFTRFSETVVNAPAEEPEQASETPAEVADTTETAAMSLAPWTWGGAVLAFVVALLWYFGRA